MRSDDWRRVDGLLEQALDLEPAARAEFVRNAAAGDPELEKELGRLVALSELEDDGLRAASEFGGGLWDRLGSSEDELGLPEDEDSEGASEDRGLEIGSRFGEFVVTAFLGAGGMGAVFRARDEHLERDVAVKVLSNRISPDETFVRRFQREAKVLASLNHPNIGAIYDLVVHDGNPYLILELVEGESLSERLRDGALPIDEAVAIAEQLVDGIEAAHAKGVVHRDLKPGNITITAEGRVKILDFGLAKPQEDAERNHASGTLTTRSGVVLGTPSYMSPEHVRGDAVDEGTDIWAFGCLLYEMLAGTRAFQGAAMSETVAAVLRDEVDWERLPASVPPALRRLLRRCLNKSARERLQHIGDARLELSELSSSFSDDRAHGPSRGLVALAAFVGAAAIATYFATRPSDRVLRLMNPVQVTSAEGRDDFPAWSPDGSALAYGAFGPDGWDVWVRRGDELVNRTSDYPGTDYAPSWSPDGRMIAFRSQRGGGGIFTMAPLDGRPRLVVARSDAIRLASAPQWSSDGTELAYAVTSSEPGASQILAITNLESNTSRTIELPLRWGCLCQVSWSPNGRFVAYIDAQNPASPLTELKLYSFDEGDTLMVSRSEARYWSPSWSGDSRELFYVSDENGSMDLWRQPLNRDGSRFGEASHVTAGVGMRHADLSRDGGKLAYSQGRLVANLFRVPILSDRPATWSDAEQLTFDRAYIEFVDVSPDGTRVVVSSDRSGNPDLWSLTLDDKELTQLTDDPTPDWLPSYSPDGRAIAFYAYRSGNRDLWIMPRSGGPARQITRHKGSDLSPGWSPDGRSLYFYSNRSGNVDLWSVSIDGGEPKQLVPDFGVDRFARASPDGKWLAFTSYRDGVLTLWRLPMDDLSAQPVALVVGDPFYLVWAKDSGSLFYTLRRQLPDIYQVSVEGGEPRAVTDLSTRLGQVGRPALATDGDNLYFTWDQDLGDIWTMDVTEQR